MTNRRAISFEGGLRTTVRSFAPDQLGALERKRNKDGSGDLILRRSDWRDNDGRSHSAGVGFFGIPNVKEMETLLNALTSKAEPGDDAPPKIGRT